MEVYLQTYIFGWFLVSFVLGVWLATWTWWWFSFGGKWLVKALRLEPKGVRL